MASPRHDSGFGLIEVLVSMGIIVMGLLGAAALMIYGTRLQTLSRDMTTARGVATQHIERLRVLPGTAPQKQVGGSLTTNVAPYFDTSTAGYTIRWTVAAGPSGTKDITIVVRPANPRTPQIAVRSLVSP